MNDELTRREVLKGLAAVSLSPVALSAEPKSESICFMSAVEMAGLIRAKKLSAREALAEHLRQIERVNPKVNAIVTLVPEMAAEAAAKADEMQAHNEKLGPLHGLPVAHKDLMETRGIRTTFGSPLFKDFIPTEDDLVVERMRLRRRDHVGQDKHSGVRSGVADIQQGFRRDTKSLRLDEDLRRIFGRRGRGAGVRNGAGGERFGCGRIVAQSCGILQCRRLSAIDRPGAQSQGGICVVDAQHLGMHGAFGRRPGARAQHDRGPGCARASLDPGAGRSFRAAARPQIQRRARGVVQGPRRRAVRPARARGRGRPSRDI